MVRGKIGFIELGMGDFEITVPVVGWEKMEVVRNEVATDLIISGERTETTEVMKTEGIHWFMAWVERRPDLLKKIETVVLSALRRLRKLKAPEVLTTKTYHPQTKTFLIRTPSREDSLRLREALVEYIEDELQGGIIVSEVDHQGVIEVICPIDKVERLIRPLQYCLSSKRSLSKAGALS